MVTSKAGIMAHYHVQTAELILSEWIGSAVVMSIM